MHVLQLTLAILKPHVLQNPVALNKIQNIIMKSDFKIIRSKRKRVQQEEAERFYQEHKGKFFFHRLVTFMTSGPSDIYILAKSNAIVDWRKLMGPTKVYRAQYEAPNSIRGQFGLSDTRNATHGSDSNESARKEIGIFFPEFDVDKWYKEEEPFYRMRNLAFDDLKFVHYLEKT